MDPKLIEKFVRKLVKGNIARRRKMKMLGFSEKQIRHLEKVSIDLIDDKELRAKVQAILDKTDDGF